MRRRPVLRSLTILGLGVAGLVGGHALGYALAFPDVHHRYAVLDATGHGYVPSISWLAVVFGAAALVTGVAAGYLHHAPDARSRSRGLIGRLIARLIAWQCGAFVALEIVERLVASAPMSSLSARLLFIGMAVQMVVALLIAFIVVGLRRLGARLASAGRIVVSTRGLGSLVRVTEGSFSSRAVARERVRGPPAALAS